MHSNKQTTVFQRTSRCSIVDDWWDPAASDSFFADVYRIGDDSFDGHLPGERLARQYRTKRECDMLDSLLRPPRESRFVDCPCGIGRHALELARRGHRVVGIDLDLQAIVQATSAARQRSLSRRLSFNVSDARNLPIGRASADFVINMFFSFGFFANDEDNFRMLQEFARVLRPSGKLLIHTDVNPKRVYQGIHSEKSPRTLPGDRALLIHEWYDSTARRLLGTWEIVDRGGASRSSSYSMRIYSHQEMLNLLVRAGFSGIQILTMSGRDITTDAMAHEIIYLASRGGK